MKKYPAIIFAVFFIPGILVQKQFAPPVLYPAGFCLFLLFLLIVLIKYSKITLLNSITACLLISSLGASYFSVYNIGRVKYPFEKTKIKDAVLYGSVSNLELSREYEIRFRLAPDSIVINDKASCSGYSFLCRVRDAHSLRLDSLYNVLANGNQLELKGVLSKGREQRNPFEFNYQKYIENFGITGLFTVYNVSDVKIINHSENYFEQFVFNIRKYLDKQISVLHAPGTAAMLKGLLIGDRSEISDDINTQFINSGVMHVIAISGQHVAYILIIFILLFGRFNIYIRSLFTVFGLIFFLLVTGACPSVFRAVVMAFVVIAGYVWNRSVNPFNAVAVSAIILIAIEPNTLFDPGFQLSYAAVLGMLTFGSFFSEKIIALNIKSSALKWLFILISVSLAAQIGTLPLTLYYFGKLSLIGLLANIIIVPLSGFIISIGIFTLIVNLIWFQGAHLYAIVNEVLCSLTLYLVKLIGEWKYAFLSINQFSLFDLTAAFLFIIVLLIYYKKFENRNAKAIFLILIAANTFIYTSLNKIDFLPANKLTVIMVDVGQGDCFLIRFPNGKTALVDAGDASRYFDNGEKTVLPLINKLGIDKIDYGFISHLESDHFGGFVSLIKRNKIANILKPDPGAQNRLDSLFEKFCSQNNVKLLEHDTEYLNVGNVKLYFLAPGIVGSRSMENRNDNSLIIFMRYGSTTFLFTGDIEEKAEEILAAKYGASLKCDVLKIPHHGSKTSSTYALLKKAAPGIALISVGNGNKFGHPSQNTIEKLKLFSAEIYRTDIEGAVFLQSDGSVIIKKNWK